MAARGHVIDFGVGIEEHRLPLATPAFKMGCGRIRMLRIRRRAVPHPSRTPRSGESAIVDRHPAGVETFDATGITAFHHDVAHDTRLTHASTERSWMTS